ncbi:LolA family protein [Henriciella litoralis]|uniref:LolA family protein n=1 Tax=Henriciella litoralis TaxID=568102 RepID=UPI000A0595DC|nr:outer membrane lipoprotein carrier protein LolA [Henriciella litoralis]
MTSLLPSIAAMFFMGTSPLAFQAEVSFVAPTDGAAWHYVPSSAQLSPKGAAPVVNVEDAVMRTVETPKLQTVQANDPTGVAPPPTPPKAEVSTETEASVETDTKAVSATDRRAILKAAANSLAAAKTAKGRFTQIAPNGSVSSGDFALRRPGRMRFDYDAPTPVLIVADGTTVAMEDRDLETVDRVPLASTPLGLILDDELSFEDEARVTDVERLDGEIAITIEDRSGESEGNLTLYFDAANYQLLSWRAVDANQQVTRVALQDIQTNVSVDPRLFRLEDPADKEDDER